MWERTRGEKPEIRAKPDFRLKRKLSDFVLQLASIIDYMSKSALKVRDMFQITVDLYHKFQSYFQFFEVIKSYQNYSCQHKNAIRKPGFELELKIEY